MILQAICTADNLFTDVFVGMAGSAHDARVLRYSPLHQNMTKDCTVLFPSDDFHIIGDSAYPLRTWLLTPFRDNGFLNTAEKRYNRKFSSGRVTIEHVFGLLKGRFRILLNLNVNVENASKIIYACCVLHNFCFLNNDTIDEFVDEDVRNFPDIVNDNNEQELAGVAKRTRICNML
jgi:hypothetical protein